LCQNISDTLLLTYPYCIERTHIEVQHASSFIFRGIQLTGSVLLTTEVIAACGISAVAAPAAIAVSIAVGIGALFVPERHMTKYKIATACGIGAVVGPALMAASVAGGYLGTLLVPAEVMSKCQTWTRETVRNLLGCESNSSSAPQQQPVEELPPPRPGLVSHFDFIINVCSLTEL
jgi:hypothetical protein